MAFFIYYLGSDLSGKNGSATLVSKEVIMNKSFPTKQEFIAEKAKFAQVMRDIMSQNYTINNTKIDEVVARSHYGIENGYQALVDHWKKTSLDGVELPPDSKDEIFVFMDEYGNFRPYRGTVVLERRTIRFNDPSGICFDDDYYESGLFDDVVNQDLMNIYVKFYDVSWVAVEINNVRDGVRDWASYSCCKQEITDFGFRLENDRLAHEVYLGDAERVVIRLKRRN